VLQRPAIGGALIMLLLVAQLWHREEYSALSDSDGHEAPLAIAEG
jgi:hypothetical protein